MLYCTPVVGLVKVIVPVGKLQVGCEVTFPVGIDGAFGAGSTVMVPPVVTQVLSPVLRTRKVYVPGATPVNVGLL